MTPAHQIVAVVFRQQFELVAGHQVGFAPGADQNIATGIQRGGLLLNTILLRGDALEFAVAMALIRCRG
nr:hypothetical protein [Pseudomonas humi]